MIATIPVSFQFVGCALFMVAASVIAPPLAVFPLKKPSVITTGFRAALLRLPAVVDNAAM